MKKALLLFGFLLSFCTAWAQFPPIEISADDVQTGLGGTVEVPIRAGTNWQNITAFNGTIIFDETTIGWDQMTFWGLTNPTGANFVYQGSGVLTFTWTSLISIGPTLNPGDIIFTLRFNVIGSAGQISPVAFNSNPQAMFWANGFGWSGNNFTETNGSVEIVCNSPFGDYNNTANNYNVDFTDLTTNIPTSWLWDFGDGNTSTQQNPNHTYASTGAYVVCLTATNACGADTHCDTITVTCLAPVASWTSTGANLNVSFSDISGNSPTSWLWDFGDGNTSTQQNPNHTYGTTGVYTVCLTTTNICGTDSTCYTQTVVCDDPTSGWTSTSNDLDAVFTDQSAGIISGWLWDFGDGNTSTQQNPNHTYGTSGVYTVCLTTTNNCGSNVDCQTVTVTCPTLAADWTFTSTNLYTDFNDLSTGAPTSWLWDFGDGNTSTDQNSNHSFFMPGTYTVCLTATNSCDMDSTCKTVTVICPTPVTGWSASPTFLDVDFTDQSTGTVTAWDWDFGDGSTNFLPNPSHTYANSGTYTVCLTAYNDCGNTQYCDTVYVMTNGLSETLSSKVSLFPNPSTDIIEIELVDMTASIALNTLTGELIAVYSASNHHKIDVSRLPSGVYFVTVNSDTGSLVKRLVKQ